MYYFKARNIDAVLDLSGNPSQVKIRVGTFLDSMWDAAVNAVWGPNWPNERGVGEHGVVLLTTNDVREFAMSQAGAAKQVIELAVKNPTHSMAKIVEIIEEATTDLTAADYIMTKLEGYGSEEQFLIYSGKTDLP